MNVLMIIADALRPDHLGCYGYPLSTSPTMDALSKDGVLFKTVVGNCNHTMPGLVTIFTGLYQNTHKIDSQEAFKSWNDEWYPGKKTPFNKMQENGITVLGCDPFVYGRTGYSLPVKDVNRQIRENSHRPFFMWYRPETTHLPYNPAPKYDKFLSKDIVLDKDTIDRLQVVRDNLIVHRTGLVAKAEIEENDSIVKEGYKRNVGIVDLEDKDRDGLLALYDGEIRTLDDEIASYIETLKECNILEDTLIVITADHGEQLLERGAVGHSSCSLEGNTFDENILIPLIMYYPKKLEKGKVIKSLCRQADIMPTIMELYSFESEKCTEGSSLIQLINGEKDKVCDYAFAYTQVAGWQKLPDDKRMDFCVRTTEHKLIFSYNPETGSRYEFYDLKCDPNERKNLYSINNPTVTDLKEKLIEFVKKSVYVEVYNDMLNW